jgi:glutamyl/glutaminyl-tRNA synthetase
LEKALIPPHPKGVRFAPSPTGRLHVGNLRTAWISHEIARAWGEPWVVRFEDIDAPRSVPGAREEQLADLASLGLRPEQVVIQSGLRQRHWDTFKCAVLEKRVYACACSRKEVREALERSGSAPHHSSAMYSGHCRLQPPTGAHGLPTLAWRFAVSEDESGHSDFIVGRSSTVLDVEGLPVDLDSFAPAYHWACAVDDWDGKYRLLVRAADLAEVLPQHRAIMAWLAASEKNPALFPAVFHTRLVTQNDGHRLEKRTRGATLEELGQLGLDRARILECFKRSWDPGCLSELESGPEAKELKEVKVAKAAAEKGSTMTLKELGLG